MSLILLNKPFHVLSQFTDSSGRATLSDCVPLDEVYPAGRLDYESEGLLLLTDNGKLQARITQPKSKIPKSYWVQVEGSAHAGQMAALCAGVRLKDGSAIALAARLIEEPQPLWPRDPPIRQRKTIPTSWIDITIDEGRNRQIRRMTASVNLPALRLIRHRVGPWALNGLQPGEVREISDTNAWRQIKS